MKDKKFLKMFLSLCMGLCIAFSLFALNVYADQNDIYYLSSQIDFDNLQAINYNSTYDNYILNYDTVDGYLKEDINNSFDNAWTGYNFLSNDFLQSYPNFIQKWVYSSQNDYTATTAGAFNFAGIEVPQVVINGDYVDQDNIKYLICINQNNNNYAWNIYIYSVYVPSGTKCWLQQGRLFASDNNVYLSGKVLSFYYDENKDYLEFKNYQDIATTNSYYTRYDFDNDSTYDLYQYYTNFDYWFYSDIPVYYIYQDHSDGSGAYLNQSPYFFGDYNGRDTNSLGKYILNENDDTGFVVDRRVLSVSQNDPEIIQDGFDPMLFDGSLGFNWFNSSGSTNYISSLDTFKPFIQLKYKINNYTDIHKDNVNLIWNASIAMKLTYDGNNNSSKFITSCRYDASGEWDLVGHENQFTLAATQESNLFSLKSVRTTSGTNPYGSYDDEFFDTNTINENISFGISSYKHNANVVTNSEEEAYHYITNYFQNNNKGNDSLDSYGFIYFNCYLIDETTGEKSVVYSSVFDLFNNRFSDNHNDLVNNDDSAYSDFVNSFNYLDQDGDLSLVDYAKPYNNNSSAYGGQSIVTITNPQFPYLLVDIPEGDWLNKTPNLTNILGDFKNALEEVHDESILPVMAQTYNYLPADMWRYLVYGVELLLMVGIWKAITRR